MKYIKYKINNNITVRKFLEAKNFSKRSIDEILNSAYLINGKPKNKSLNLKKGDELKIIVEDEDLDYEPIEGRLKILFEDANSLVVSKNSKLTVNSKNQVNLSNYLAYYFKENDIRAKIRLVNRLDMNTSGLMLIAKNKYAHAYYQRQVENNLMKKKYLAVVDPNTDLDFLYEERISYDEENKKYIASKNGKIARTYFKTIDKNDSYSLIECEIFTGKTHQIRVSLQSLGHPIYGDKLYGSDKDLDRFLLHSYKLEFKTFIDGENIKLEDWPNFMTFLCEKWKQFDLQKSFSYYIINIS